MWKVWRKADKERNEKQGKAKTRKEMKRKEKKGRRTNENSVRTEQFRELSRHMSNQRQPFRFDSEIWINRIVNWKLPIENWALRIENGHWQLEMGNCTLDITNRSITISDRSKAMTMRMRMTMTRARSKTRTKTKTRTMRMRMSLTKRMTKIEWSNNYEHSFRIEYPQLPIAKDAIIQSRIKWRNTIEHRKWGWE
jgi:hypothetical protein